jgi:hypothetical protein
MASVSARNPNFRRANVKRLPTPLSTVPPRARDGIMRGTADRFLRGACKYAEPHRALAAAASVIRPANGLPLSCERLHARSGLARQGGCRDERSSEGARCNQPDAGQVLFGQGG